jgi:Kelch motif/Galactose oxidase, central domain
VLTLYSVKSDWQVVNAKGPVPSSRHSHTANLYKDTAVVFGGADGSQFFGDVFTYHFPTATWTQQTTKGSGPSPRANHASVVVGSKLYVIGGNDASGVLGDAFTLDLETWEWTEQPGFPPARTAAAAVAIGTKVSL